MENQMTDLNLEKLAYDFVSQNYLEMARDIEYQKVLSAMQLAADHTMTVNNQKLADTLKKVQQDRISGDMPK